MKQVQAEDGRGRVWIVYEDDLAWTPCQLLAKAGLSQVVLPESLFLRGELPSADSLQLLTPSIEVVRQAPEVRTIALRNIRLRDCVTHLAIPGRWSVKRCAGTPRPKQVRRVGQMRFPAADSCAV